MKNSLHSDFVYQLSALILSIIIVHGTYVTLIRPNAEAILAHQAQLEEEMQEKQGQSRSFYIIIKDYEQEAAFILMFWALGIMGFKAYRIRQERRLLHRDLITIEGGMSLLPEDAHRYVRPLQALSHKEQIHLPAKALSVALRRFSTTRNIQNTSDSLNALCEQEANRLDSELAIIRYISWAIPSIGFIGTVRGIGAALGDAHKAVEGNIAGVTANLGVAFNSTFIALILSIILMFLLHQVQLTQERLVLDTQDYVDEKLIQHMQVR